MKNLTTTFSIPGFKPTYFYFGYPKYKNVKLVHPSDAGYQAYRHALIAAKIKRPVGYVAKQTSFLYQVSKTVEYVVRCWWGSQANRIIRYEVFYNGTYHIHYKECDIVKVEANDTIAIGEVKSSNRSLLGKAASQLQQSTEILSNIFHQVKPFAIGVNMASLNSTGSLKDVETTEHLFPTGFTFQSIILSLGDIMDFVQENALNANHDLLRNAYQEALECVRKRTEKLQIRLLDSCKQDTPPPNTISPFGMLLQKALSQNGNL